MHKFKQILTAQNNFVIGLEKTPFQIESRRIWIRLILYIT